MNDGIMIACAIFLVLLRLVALVGRDGVIVEPEVDEDACPPTKRSG